MSNTFYIYKEYKLQFNNCNKYVNGSVNTNGVTGKFEGKNDRIAKNCMLWSICFLYLSYCWCTLIVLIYIYIIIIILFNNIIYIYTYKNIRTLFIIIDVFVFLIEKGPSNQDF